MHVLRLEVEKSAGVRASRLCTVADLNRHLFDAINGWPDGVGPFFRFFSVAMNYAWVKGMLGLLVVGMVWRPGPSRRAAVQALLAVGIANGLTDLLKHGLGTARPCTELAGIPLHGIGCVNSMGTASAHSANMAAVAFVFVYYLRWWGSPWVLVALFTGLSRVYLGAHYPWQVLLGWTCGCVAAALVTQGWGWYSRKQVPAGPLFPSEDGSPA